MMSGVIKTLVCLTLLGAMPRESFAVTAEDVEERITETFASARQALAADPTGLESQRILNKSRLLIDTIQPYFYGVPGALHEHSDARQQRVEQVESWLGKYEQFFVRLIGTLSDPATDSSVVADYVKFTKPTPQIKRALVDVARSESARPDNAAAAFDGIFYLELDDTQIRREVVETLGWMDERHSRSKLAASIRNMGATSWALPEMLDYWRDSLSTPFLPENYPERGGEQKLAVQYRWAASALSHFGKMDNGLAELVRQRAEELREAGGHQRTIEKLIFAAEVLEGTRPPEIAVNWKGQLLGASRTAVKRQERSENEVVETTQTPMPEEAAKPVERNVEENPEQKIEGSSSKWLWVIVSVAIIGILFVLIRAFMRGRSS